MLEVLALVAAALAAVHYLTRKKDIQPLSKSLPQPSHQIAISGMQPYWASRVRQSKDKWENLLDKLLLLDSSDLLSFPAWFSPIEFDRRLNNADSFLRRGQVDECRALLHIIENQMFELEAALRDVSVSQRIKQARSASIAKSVATEANIQESTLSELESCTSSLPGLLEFQSLAEVFLKTHGIAVVSRRKFKDMDIDFICESSNQEKILARCRYMFDVRKPTVQALVSDLGQIGATKGILITLGTAGSNAMAYAEGNAITLWDGKILGIV